MCYKGSSVKLHCKEILIYNYVCYSPMQNQTRLKPVARFKASRAASKPGQPALKLVDRQK